MPQPTNHPTGTRPLYTLPTLSENRTLWLGSPWLLLLTCLFTHKACSGFLYDSPGPINLALRIAHAAGWGMLPLLTLMWVPVMRGLLNLLETARIGHWLPLEGFRSSHRWFGWIAIALALTHAVGWLLYDASLAQPLLDVLFGTPEQSEQGLTTLRARLVSAALRINGSGLLLCMIFVMLGWTSRLARRRRNYDSFQRRHRYGYAVALLLLLHVQPPYWGWLLLPIPVLLIELWLVRRGLLQRACPAHVQLDAPGVVSLSLQSRIASKPGHYVQLRIPALNDKPGCWHAFSLADAGKQEGQWVVKISAAGDWTRRLAALAEHGPQTLHVDVRGPFASPAAQGLACGNCLLVSGGIGVTPFLSLVRGFLDSDQTRTVHFVWIVRHPQLLQWIVPLANALAKRRHVALHWHLYQDGDIDIPLPRLKTDDNGVIEVQRGRPDWDTLLAEIARQTPHLSTFTCGPQPLMADVKRYAQAFGWPVRTEKFG
jgi:ferredoxin-NADP reductase